MDLDPDGILVLTRHYAPEPVGSAPPLREMVEWLARTRSVNVVTVRPNYPERAIFSGFRNGERDRERLNGVMILRWPTLIASGTGLLARVPAEAEFLIRVLTSFATRRLSQYKTVISLCPSILTVIGGAFLCRKDGHHTVIVHDIQSGLGRALGSTLVRRLIPIIRALEKWALNRADTVVVLSHEMSHELKRIGITTEIIVQPPMINAKAAIIVKPKQGECFTAMYSGNIGKKQGLGQVIRLAEVLQQRRSTIKIIIRGEGTEKEALIQEARRLGLNNLTFEALVSEERMWEGLAEADLHLVPQVAGGEQSAVPSKIYAIMAAERTFVATANPGSTLSNLAISSNSFACSPTDDAIALADLVQRLESDRATLYAMARMGRTYALENADTAVVMGRLEPVLTGVIK